MVMLFNHYVLQLSIVQLDTMLITTQIFAKQSALDPPTSTLTMSLNNVSSNVDSAGSHLI